MFKQVFVMIFFTIVSYLTMDYILKKSLRRFYFINGIIKYPLNCKIKNAVYSNFSEIKDLDNFIFYTTEEINCNNYIYDYFNDYYYLIEPRYYYYINKKKSNGIILNFDVNSFIFYLKIK
jgi:hypothetical protein